MDQQISKDCLTKYQIEGKCKYFTEKDYFEYYSRPVGVVKIYKADYKMLLDKFEEYQKQRILLAGFCRFCFDRKLILPIIISVSGLRSLLSDIIYPITLSEKKERLLEHLYIEKVEEQKNFKLIPIIDHPITYSNLDEFRSIVRSLIRDRFIKARYHQDDTYSHVTLTPAGIKYIEEPLIEEIDLYGLLNGYEIDQIKKMIMMSSRHHEVIPQIEKLLIKKKPTRREFKSFNLIKEKVNTINTKLKKKVISIDLANNQKFSILKAILNMLN